MSIQYNAQKTELGLLNIFGLEATLRALSIPKILEMLQQDPDLARECLALVAQQALSEKQADLLIKRIAPMPVDYLIELIQMHNEAVEEG
ncbi:MAG: hypothetical protein ABR99_03530 [Rhodobacter sp. BACL10 MAG-121220-bin24]|jgi:hypothetical protein|nr:MAG: hypothetical protein ABR99_03530 [Rhodobacter sp. BACL10 MAG-121220-bin24]